jgi:OOP family OmpA-OmpF porin
MKKAMTLVALAFASSVSFAQGARSSPVVGPWYVGASGGRSAANLDDWDYYNSYTLGGLPFTGLVTMNTDTRDKAWRIFLGYNINQNWAVEGAYTDLGRIKAHYTHIPTRLPLFEVTGDQVAWSAAVKGTLPINKQFDVFALLGATSNRTKITVTEINIAFVGGVPSGSDHRTGLMTGLGVEVKPSPNLGIRLEYQNYDQFGGSGRSLNDTLRMSVDAWLLGVNAKF